MTDAAKGWLNPMPDVTRFAPSPTGYLHLGHAYSALFARARSKGGTFLLRIEDIDQTRCRPEFETAIAEDLAWLGLTWPLPARRQSEHFGAYGAALATLDNAGLLFPCFCTRADIQHEIKAAAGAPHGPDGPLYPGTCRHLSSAEQQRKIAEGKPYALRLRMTAAISAAGPLTWRDDARGDVAATPEIFGDVVLARKDTPASYHLACTWDDAVQNVTLVTRGDDLRPATHIHRLLQALLRLPTPRYLHHPLLKAQDSAKLSKRDNAPAIRDLRAAGRTPAQVIAQVIEMVGAGDLM